MRHILDSGKSCRSSTDDQARPPILRLRCQKGHESLRFALIANQLDRGWLPTTNKCLSSVLGVGAPILWAPPSIGRVREARFRQVVRPRVEPRCYGSFDKNNIFDPSTITTTSVNRKARHFTPICSDLDNVPVLGVSMKGEYSEAQPASIWRISDRLCHGAQVASYVLPPRPAWKQLSLRLR